MQTVASFAYEIVLKERGLRSVVGNSAIQSKYKPLINSIFALTKYLSWSLFTGITGSLTQFRKWFPFCCIGQGVSKGLNLDYECLSEVLAKLMCKSVWDAD